MGESTFRTLRYARAWLAGPQGCLEEELALERSGVTIPATLARPSRASGPLPGWIVLHGVTRRGRAHEQLARFTRTIVSTGAVAIVPEVPEWREFQLAPRLAVPTVRAAIAALRASGWVRDARVGLIGFSFGAPHAIAATAHPDVGDELAGSVAFGGYCSLRRTVRFLMTGTHDWNGVEQSLIPDAYGRWIVASNYLTAVPGYEGAGDVTDALRALCAHAGDHAIPGLDPRLDGLKAELRARLPEERRELFDLFAPEGDRLPDPGRAEEMAEDIAEAARRSEPAIEPAPALADVELPVHLLHARNDNLVPYSEGLRLHRCVPSRTPSRITITRLFGHSGQSAFPSLARTLQDLPVFLPALRSVLRLV
jgi:pimeloyl-ACP methyl ester carboxylesterase